MQGKTTILQFKLFRSVPHSALRVHTNKSPFCLCPSCLYLNTEMLLLGQPQIIAVPAQQSTQTGRNHRLFPSGGLNIQSFASFQRWGLKAGRIWASWQRPSVSSCSQCHIQCVQGLFQTFALTWSWQWIICTPRSSSAKPLNILPNHGQISVLELQSHTIHWEATANRNSRNIWEATRALLHHPWLRVPCSPPDSWGGNGSRRKRRETEPGSER